MRNKSELLRERMWEQVREVKVVIFCEKARSIPFAGLMVYLQEILSDVSFNGKQEIWMRSVSRSMLLRLRELRLVNLLKRPLRSVDWRISKENRRRLVMERNCLETRDREFK
jgi:Leu/Phe-tRNA-protein transferase